LRKDFRSSDRFPIESGSTFTRGENDGRSLKRQANCSSLFSAAVVARLAISVVFSEMLETYLNVRRHISLSMSNIGSSQRSLRNIRIVALVCKTDKYLQLSVAYN